MKRSMNRVRTQCPLLQTGGLPAVGALCVLVAASGCLVQAFDCSDDEDCSGGKCCVNGRCVVTEDGRCREPEPDAAADAEPGGCPADPVFQGDCPAVCSGGCGQGTCIILCDRATGEGQCQNRTFVCPDTLPCRVECRGWSSCQASRFHCSDQASCEIACLGQASCELASIGCGRHACSVYCGELAVAPALDCGSSCRCENLCQPTDGG